MTRLLPVLLMLAGLSSSTAFAAEPHHAEQRAAHFQHTKSFALTALDERMAILQRERQCVSSAATPADMRRCHADAGSERAALKARLHPQYERLQSGGLPN